MRHEIHVHIQDMRHRVEERELLLITERELHCTCRKTLDLIGILAESSRFIKVMAVDRPNKLGEEFRIAFLSGIYNMTLTNYGSINIQVKSSKHYNFLGTLKEQIAAQHRRNQFPKVQQPHQRDALDSLLSAQRCENEVTNMSSDLFSETDDDKKTPNDMQDAYTSDSSGNGTRFKHRTGIFTQDFPPSPKVPKGKGKKIKTVHVTEPVNSNSDVTTVMPT